VSAERGGRQVIAVVLGSDNIALDGQVLLDYAYANYDWLRVDSGFSRRVPMPSQTARVGEALVALPGWEDPRFRWETIVDGPVAERDAPVVRLVVESALRRLGLFTLVGPAGPD
jgi:hypothetical protein